MSMTFRPYAPDQSFLMPVSMHEWLPSGHLAYFVTDVVDQLDLTAILEHYEREERGYPPYHPRMMVKANASKHKAMSYKRMKEEEARLEAEVKELLKRAESTDAEEDRTYGKERRGDELPKELALRESRLKKIREARQALEAEARQKTEAEDSVTVAPKDNAQRNFTDADSRIMPASGGKHFIQGYNAQAAVDSKQHVIVAAEITNRPVDRGQAELMMDVVYANTGRLPDQMSADAGYFSSDTVNNLTARGIDAYVPPNKTRHGSIQPSAPRGRMPLSLSTPDRMRRKLRTKRGRECYALRKVLPEPVFGQIKQARGFRQFLLRGLDKVSGEWQVICTGHNLLKLWKAQRQELVQWGLRGGSNVDIDVLSSYSSSLVCSGSPGGFAS